MILHAFLGLAIFSSITSAQLSEESVKLLTKNDGNYQASFTYTVEDFLALPYVERSNFFKVIPFSTKSQGQVKWYFEIEPGHQDESDANVNLKLFISSLPDNILHISSSAECSILDINGTRHHVQNTGKKILQVGENFNFKPLITRLELESSSKTLLPNGHLTIQCNVEGMLMFNINNTKGVIPTEELQEITKSSDCGANIATDTLNRLNLFDDNILGHVELRSFEKSVKCHKDILSARSVYFKAMLLEIGDKEDISKDLSADVNELELQDLVEFTYRGQAPNLDKTCRVLYPVSKRYRMDCLNIMCQNVLEKQIKSKNALEFLKYAQDVGSEKLTSAAAYCIYSPTAYNCRW